MDIGHLRHVRWVKDDDPKSQINDRPELKQNNKSAAQNRWIAYNKMRGQYASAMEHAAPEAFWVDKTKCSHADENRRIQIPTLNPYAEGISAVKAIAIAQAEGQKIYTINKANAQTALQKLPTLDHCDICVYCGNSDTNSSTIFCANWHNFGGACYIHLDFNGGHRHHTYCDRASLSF